MGTDFDQGFLPKDFTWPEKYGNFRQKISGITASDPVSYFVPLDAFPSKITSAPVTEIVRAFKPFVVQALTLTCLGCRRS